MKMANSNAKVPSATTKKRANGFPTTPPEKNKTTAISTKEK